MSESSHRAIPQDIGHEDNASAGRVLAERAADAVWHDDDGDRYPPIGDYAFLSDCRSVALVSREGSIDWCCMPRADAGSVFGRLLDWNHAGYFRVAPVAEATGCEREYLGKSMVMATTITTDDGAVRLVDGFTLEDEPPLGGHHELVRVVEGVRGSVECRVIIAPRFDYAGVNPWIRIEGDGVWSAVGGNDALVITADVALDYDDHEDLVGTFTVGEGERVHLSVRWVAPQDVEDTCTQTARGPDLRERLEATVSFWEQWATKTEAHDASGDPRVVRSALVLKGLVNAPTGAVMAAPTTSLPEAIGHERNWDYRYSWIRDSHFTVAALAELGCEAEADGFRRFIEAATAGSPESMHIVYGLGGERRITEVELDHLEGYRGSRPVRAGNDAAKQVQLDTYGYLVDLAWRWLRKGTEPNADHWRFLTKLVDTAAELWEEPDRGIWEVRGDPRHFVHSKVMCWVALDRGVRIAEDCHLEAPLDRWRKTRDAIRASVEHAGYDDGRGTFVREYGAPDVDASLLLLPFFDFVPFDDERMVRTTDAVIDALTDGGLLRRYADEDDGLGGTEGVFLSCTFWLVVCLARQGRRDEAEDWYERACATANDVGLFAEELDAATGELLGNFPQGLTHLSHVAAAVALAGPFDLER